MLVLLTPDLQQLVLVFFFPSTSANTPLALVMVTLYVLCRIRANVQTQQKHSEEHATSPDPATAHFKIETLHNTHKHIILDQLHYYRLHAHILQVYIQYRMVIVQSYESTFCNQFRYISTLPLLHNGLLHNSESGGSGIGSDQVSE